MSPSFSHSSFHMFVLFKINDRSSGVESCVKEKAKYSTLTCGLKCWFSWFGSLSNIMMDSRNILISFTLFCYSKVVSFKIYRLFCENCCCKFTTHYIMIENQRPHISWWCCYIYMYHTVHLPDVLEMHENRRATITAVNLPIMTEPNCQPRFRLHTPGCCFTFVPHIYMLSIFLNLGPLIICVYKHLFNHQQLDNI